MVTRRRKVLRVRAVLIACAHQQMVVTLCVRWRGDGFTSGPSTGAHNGERKLDRALRHHETLLERVCVQPELRRYLVVKGQNKWPCVMREIKMLVFQATSEY